MKNYFDIQSSMIAPKYESEQQNIKDIIEGCVGKNIIWKYPLHDGKYSSVIRMNIEKNTDCQDKNYAVAFFSGAETPDELHMMFLVMTNNKWKPLKDITYNAFDVSNVYIGDVDDNQKNEVVVFVNGTNDFYEEVHVYQYESENLKEINISDDLLNKLKETIN